MLNISDSCSSLQSSFPAAYYSQFHKSVIVEVRSRSREVIFCEKNKMTTVRYKLNTILHSQSGEDED
jgi:hypothetical protein